MPDHPPPGLTPEPVPSTAEERFSVLVEATHMALLAYAVRRVSVPDDAADVVAETFLVAWRRIDDVPAGDSARPWLFGVARKVMANVRRADHRRTALADRLRDHVVETVGPIGHGESDVERALARLGEDDQELLRLTAWEQLAHDEIAVVLGVSRGAVRVRLHRARRRLAAQLEAHSTQHSQGRAPRQSRATDGARLAVAPTGIEGER